MLAIWSKMTLHPLKRLILGAHSELSADRAGAAGGGRGVLRWLAVAGDGLDESAWARAFQTSCLGRSTRRPALSEPMKLPSEARIRRWALVSFWAA